MDAEIKRALLPLVQIADAYDANELDNEARKKWGKDLEHENKRPPALICLYSGRGGRELLTLADCLEARRVFKESEEGGENDEALRSAFCDTHLPGSGGRFGGCLVCAAQKLTWAISRIDYLLGSRKREIVAKIEMEVSEYDVHQDPEKVIEKVRGVVAGAGASERTSESEILKKQKLAEDQRDFYAYAYRKAVGVVTDFEKVSYRAREVLDAYVQSESTPNTPFSTRTEEREKAKEALVAFMCYLRQENRKPGVLSEREMEEIVTRYLEERVKIESGRE